jgi:MFS family permease
MSIFMMGLPIGVALSYFVSSQVAAKYGWRQAFFVAGVPGILCALAALFLREPARGTKETHPIGSKKRDGSPYGLVLATPTMRWIILSGALHNCNLYAISAFQMPYLMRYHGVSLIDAGRLSTLLALAGIPGLLLGGFVGDLTRRSNANGRLLVGALAFLVSGPMSYLALNALPGDLLGFGVFMAIGSGLMFVYYGTVYSAIQDVVEPSLRGTAMALYFCAMYVMGASFGPVLTGFLSERFAQSAATASGVNLLTKATLEPFRGAGLHSAMYVVPAVSGVLAIVLVAASFTVRKDMEKLNGWMLDLDGPRLPDQDTAMDVAEGEEQTGGEDSDNAER